MRLQCLFASAIALLALAGCHSAFIDATVSNHTALPIPLIEVDYPTASFGTENLAPGKDFHYRFKVLGDGPMKVVYTESGQQEKHLTGPGLREGDEGPLLITFSPDGVHWQLPPSKH
ncbi:hypothetical protein [Granulicella arctica]|uniref:hypothetical protein n=1 Tax=Granulicella arctica TaxID=940613 RepID=UPI0021DF5264|nr:hypothetical protein [Granulicella arctica]